MSKIKFIVTSNEPSEEAIGNFNQIVNEIVDDILLRDPEVTPQETDRAMDEVN